MREGAFPDWRCRGTLGRSARGFNLMAAEEAGDAEIDYYVETKRSFRAIISNSVLGYESAG